MVERLQSRRRALIPTTPPVPSEPEIFAPDTPLTTVRIIPDDNGGTIAIVEPIDPRDVTPRPEPEQSP